MKRKKTTKKTRRIRLIAIVTVAAMAIPTFFSLISCGKGARDDDTLSGMIDRKNDNLASDYGFSTEEAFNGYTEYTKWNFRVYSHDTSAETITVYMVAHRRTDYDGNAVRKKSAKAEIVIMDVGTVLKDIYQVMKEGLIADPKAKQMFLYALDLLEETSGFVNDIEAQQTRDILAGMEEIPDQYLFFKDKMDVNADGVLTFSEAWSYLIGRVRA